MEHRNIAICLKHNGTDPIERELIGDEEYFKIPAVMLKHGVFTASKMSNPEGYSTYYPDKALKNSVPSWNGRAVSVGHPSDGMSMNTPKNLSESIGFIFDTLYDPQVDGLKATLAIHPEKGAEIVRKFSSGEMVDVSTGVWGSMVRTPGDFNGKAYDEYYSDIIGDHLAILPGGVGACSSADGCGLREMEAHTSEDQDKVESLVDSEIESKTGKENMSEKKEATVEQVKKDLSLEEVMDHASSEVKALLNDALDKRDLHLKAEKVRRDGLVSKINGYDGVNFCPKFLEAYDIETINNIGLLVDVLNSKVEAPKANESVAKEEVVDYSLNSSKVVEDGSSYPVREIPVN